MRNTEIIVALAAKKSLSASFGNCFATEAKHEAEQAYRNSVRGTV